ncbi:MAG: pentapeptide repeat-containing protein [Cyanobacteria bacterium P01_A01_bin.135]
MTNPTLTRARAGDPAAIAALINRQLQPKGIRVRGDRDGDHLTLTLIAAESPTAEAVMAFLQRGLARLSPQGIQTAAVIAQSPTRQTYWRQPLPLRSSPPPKAAPPDHPDADAITARINQAIAPKNVTAQTLTTGNRLMVLLQAVSCPDQGTMMTLLARSLPPLTPTIKRVTVFGQQQGGDFPDWTADLPIPETPPPSKPAISPAKPSQKPAENGTFALELGASRYDLPANAVLVVTGVLALLIWQGSGPVGVSLAGLVALLPAAIASRRGRPFLSWYCYGFIFFLGALVLALLLSPTPKPDFSGQSLQNRSFRGQFLKGVSFRNANLDGADFSSAVLSGATFEGASGVGACFNRATLSGTNFSGATLKQASFDAARTGPARRSIGPLLSQIPLSLWAIITIGGILLFVSSLVPGARFFAIGRLFLPVLLLSLAGLAAVAWGTVAWWQLYYQRPQYGQWILLAAAVLPALLCLAKPRPATITVVVLAALVAFSGRIVWLVRQQRWRCLWPWMGALLGVSVDELMPVLVTAALPAWGLFFLLWGSGAITGRIARAWTEEGMLRFVGADLTDATFKRATLHQVDFRQTSLPPDVLTTATVRQAFFSKNLRQAVEE